MSTITEAKTNKQLSAHDLSKLTDEELIARYQKNGKEFVFAELIQRYERELFNYLRRYLGNATMAEDAFQATFLQVHLKCESFESGRKFRPWLYTVATNAAIDIQRRNKRHQLVSLDRPHQNQHAEIGTLRDLLGGREINPADGMESRERLEWVRRAVAALPEQLQAAVGLIYFRGMKYREAAVELAVPVGTVKSRLHAAVNRLSEAWAEQESSRR